MVRAEWLWVEDDDKALAEGDDSGCMVGEDDLDLGLRNPTDPLGGNSAQGFSRSL